MVDVLIRGLSDATVARIDADATARGLSRNEYLRRSLESGPAGGAADTLSVADLHRAAQAAQDLDDKQIMDSAWR